jgi:hypothetical protein
VCGLNTKLDHVELPSREGNHELTIHYLGSRLLPGTYYVHVGFFGREGVVEVAYKAKAASFYVHATDYKAEGLCLLDHRWEVESETKA